MEISALAFVNFKKKSPAVEAGKIWGFFDLEFLNFFQLLFKNLLYLVGLFIKLKKI